MTEAHKHIFIDLLYPYIYKTYVLLCFCAYVLMCLCAYVLMSRKKFMCFCAYVLLSKKNQSIVQEKKVVAAGVDAECA